MKNSPMDARSLSLETQNYLRQQAIRLRKEGKTFTDIAHYLGVHRNTTSGWWHEYEQQGEAALKQRTRGRKIGAGRRLSHKDEVRILGAMTNNIPMELTDYWAEEILLKYFPEVFPLGRDSIQLCPLEDLMSLTLWTQRDVQALIEVLCGIELPIRTVGEYLKRWGVSPNHPLEGARKTNLEATAQWETQTYPEIVKKAKHLGAEILWGDVSKLYPSISLSGQHLTTFFGERVLEGDLGQAEQAPINLVASTNNQGHVRFMLFPAPLTPINLATFLGS